VEYRFKADEWASLNTAERIQRCRRMAEEARALAENAPLSLSEAYLSIASDWLQLAAEIERGGERSR